MKPTPIIWVCPFCGSIPEIGLAKKTYCSLHGDPAQEVFVKCKKHECPAKPKVSHGDVYNGGYDQAKEEAILKWNTRSENHIPKSTVDALLEAAKFTLEEMKRKYPNPLLIKSKLEKAIQKTEEK